MNTSAESTKIQTTAPTVSSTASLPSIPDYTLIQEIGRGGMGVVYEARQETTQRIVAIKMILSGCGAGVPELARFRVEAEAVACLQHPNIIRIHDVGIHERCPYFALEYAGGGSLANPKIAIPRSPEWAAEIVRKLAQAMHLAHGRGILHRDLKPANVLLMEDGTPKISDFGLAKFEQPLQKVSEAHCTMSVSGIDNELVRLMFDYIGNAEWQKNSSMEQFILERSWQQLFHTSGPNPDDPGWASARKFVDDATIQVHKPRAARWSAILAELTQAGTIMGSPQYMSPEQASGDTEMIGPRSDIYALGIILYYLLAGRTPFQGRNIPKILADVQTQSPPPFQPRVHPDLEAICFKCLQKSIVERYATADDLAEDLHRYLQGKRTLAGQSESRNHPANEPDPNLDNGTLEAVRTDRENPSDPNRTRSWWKFWK
jgi:serine/threonine protein kinase